MLAMIDITAVVGRMSTMVIDMVDRSVMRCMPTVVGTEFPTINCEFSSTLEEGGHVVG